MSEQLPPPLIGCLFCHTEGQMTQSEGRRVMGFGGDFPVITCQHCGAVAWLDWDGQDTEHWRIRYRKVPTDLPYNYAALRFEKAGWVEENDALDISTEIYIHNQRLAQVKAGEIAWLKPTQLHPPPPLMGADEKVYLSLKPASYCETRPASLLNRSIVGAVLDTGTLYVTDSKIHLLGQRRDRSHRLREVSGVSYDDKLWYIHFKDGERGYHYQGFGQDTLFDTEMIAGIIETLLRAPTSGDDSNP